MTVGMPVFNAERYLEQAISSILEQTFQEVTLLIADNASTDATQEICRSYGRLDDRVRYHRHKENIGGINNFDFVLRHGKNEYFKWAAHDDVCEPDLIRRCVEVLDADPTVVLAYTQTIDIDEQGNEIRLRDIGLGLDSGDPYERFRRLMSRGHGATMLYGVHRWEVLARSLPQGSFYGSDRPFLGELALRGRFFEVPEALFLRRQHEDRSVRGHANSYGVPEWFAPGKVKPFAMPTWRRLLTYLRVIARVPVSLGTKVRSYAFMVRWVVDLRSGLLFEVRLAATAMIRRLTDKTKKGVAVVRFAARGALRRLRSIMPGRSANPAYIRDPHGYWDDRHRSAGASLEGVGCAGLGPANALDYEAKWDRLKALLDASSLEPGDRVVDAGCGVGFFSKRLATLGLQVEGVDFSEEALAIADQERTRGVTWHLGALDEFSLEPPAKLVICIDVLFHILDDEVWAAGVRNLARHVSDEGRLVIQEELRDPAVNGMGDDRPHVRRRSLTDYQNLLEGWVLVEHLRYELPGQGSTKDLLCFEGG